MHAGDLCFEIMDVSGRTIARHHSCAAFGDSPLDCARATRRMLGLLKATKQAAPVVAPALEEPPPASPAVEAAASPDASKKPWRGSPRRFPPSRLANPQQERRPIQALLGSDQGDAPLGISLSPIAADYSATGSPTRNRSPGRHSGSIPVQHRSFKLPQWRAHDPPQPQRIRTPYDREFASLTLAGTASIRERRGSRGEESGSGFGPPGLGPSDPDEILVASTRGLGGSRRRGRTCSPAAAASHPPYAPALALGEDSTLSIGLPAPDSVSSRPGSRLYPGSTRALRRSGTPASPEMLRAESSPLLHMSRGTAVPRAQLQQINATTQHIQHMGDDVSSLDAPEMCVVGLPERPPERERSLRQAQQRKSTPELMRPEHLSPSAFAGLDSPHLPACPMDVLPGSLPPTGGRLTPLAPPPPPTPPPQQASAKPPLAGVRRGVSPPMMSGGRLMNTPYNGSPGGGLGGAPLPSGMGTLDRPRGGAMWSSSGPAPELAHLANSPSLASSLADPLARADGSSLMPSFSASSRLVGASSSSKLPMPSLPAYAYMRSMLASSPPPTLLLLGSKVRREDELQRDTKRGPITPPAYRVRPQTFAGDRGEPRRPMAR